MNDPNRIEFLIARCRAIPDPELRADVIELLRLVLELHGSGLRHLLRPAAESPHLEALIAAWARDPEVHGLCELHGLEIPRRPEQVAIPSHPPTFVPLDLLTAR